ncbi:hypothetical protein VTO73DRAFT_12273 [Trametes versicolor]
MIRPAFILTCAFIISALFLDDAVSPVAHAAPLPPKATVAYSALELRSCSKLGCLYAVPDTDASNDDNTTATVSPSADASSALQVIDLLISAMESAASSLDQASTTIPAAENSTVLATETSVDAQ